MSAIHPSRKSLQNANLMKVNKLTTKVTVQRRFLLQFLGLPGSEEPSHPMIVSVFGADSVLMSEGATSKVVEDAEWLKVKSSSCSGL